MEVPVHPPRRRVFAEDQHAVAALGHAGRVPGGPPNVHQVAHVDQAQAQDAGSPGHCKRVQGIAVDEQAEAVGNVADGHGGHYVACR